MARHVARGVFFAFVLTAEVLAVRTSSACPTVESFRHRHIVESKTIMGARHLVLRGHCGGLIVVRARFTATQKPQDDVRLSDLLQRLNGLEREVFVPELFELKQARKHVVGRPLHLQGLGIRREAQSVAAATAVGQLHHGVNTAKPSMYALQLRQRTQTCMYV